MEKYVLPLLIFLFFTSCSKEKRSDKKGEKMQDFVINLSNYAREIKPDFIVIPQNGAELAFNYMDENDGEHASYLAAIDGIGIEELFYNGDYTPDEERLSMLRKLKNHTKILVSEYVSDNSNIDDAVQKNLNEEFICFPRAQNNYDYLYIPNSVVHENTNDILKLADAQNYLYMISTGNYSSKQDFIQAVSNTNFDVIIMDLFFDENEFTSFDINQLKTKANGGKRLVISYMNVGAAEKYRYYWQDGWRVGHPSWLKKKYDGYDDEIWVKFWKKDWTDIIYGDANSYTKKIINAGFDGAYLDNVEAFYFLYFD